MAQTTKTLADIPLQAMVVERHPPLQLHLHPISPLCQLQPQPNPLITHHIAYPLLLQSRPT